MADNQRLATGIAMRESDSDLGAGMPETTRASKSAPAAHTLSGGCKPRYSVYCIHRFQPRYRERPGSRERIVERTWEL
jgi:hypothetical protein